MAQIRSDAVARIAAKRRWTAQEAAVVLAAAERSGLTLVAFAALHGLDRQRLYRWSRQVGESLDVPEPVAFAEVVVAPAGRGAPMAGGQFEVVLRSGRMIRVVREFDADALRRLVAVLEEVGPC